MIYNKKKWKEISYKEYKKLTKNQNDLEIAFNDKVCKELNYSTLIPNGEGIIEYIRKIQEESVKEHLPEDYRYFKADEYETVIIGSEETLNMFEKVLSEECNRKLSKDK